MQSKDMMIPMHVDFLNIFLSNWIVQTLLVFLSQQQSDPKHSHVYKAIPDMCRYLLIMDCFITNVMGLIKHIFVIYSVLYSCTPHAYSHTKQSDFQHYFIIDMYSSYHYPCTRRMSGCLGVNVFMILYWLILEVCEMNRTHTCT